MPQNKPVSNKQTVTKVKTLQQHKDKKYAQTLVKNGFNGSKTVKQLMNPATDGHARSMANQKMKERGVQKALEEVLNETGLDSDRISELMARNAEQTKNLSASNTAIDMTLKVRGDYAPTKSMSISTSLTPEERKQAIKDLQQDFKELTIPAPKNKHN